MEFGTFFFIGGMDCVNLCNTFDHEHQPPQYDFLPDSQSVLEWGKAAGILPAAARWSSQEGIAAFRRVIATRALLHRVLSSLIKSCRPEFRDLEELEARFRKASASLRIVATRDGYVLSSQGRNPLEQVEIAAVRSAVDFLLAGDRPPLRQCPGCGWLFLDTSRNHMRRWCDMRICGNRAKVRRHYERARRKKRGASAG
jgi:predicted RNA-binding Zn ribbon-like protein